MIPFFLSLGSQQNTNTKYLQTALNGDLSPTAEDQLQIFSSNAIVIRGTTAYNFYTSNGQATGTGLSDIDKIFLATKDLTIDQDFTQGWVRYNGGSGDAVAVLDTGTGWEASQVFCRCVIDDNGTFKMWYSGMNTSFVVSTGYAESTDGITWSKSGSNPIYQDIPNLGSTGNVFFAVIKDGLTYRALAAGDRNINTNGLNYLTSSDGISWTTQQTGILTGGTARAVHSIERSGSNYYVYFDEGANLNYGGAGGITTTLAVYETTDFINYTKIRDIHTKIEPQESGCYGANLFTYGSNYYLMYSYWKNQVKFSGNNGEPFMGERLLESKSRFFNNAGLSISYPSYLKRYYPLYQSPETQTPQERINNDQATTTGTITWNQRRYAQFTGTQNISYPEYTPSDPTKFAVKARVSQSLTGTLNIVQQDDTSRGWVMYLVNGLLTVDLYQSDVLTKSYVTTTQIVKPPGVYDVYDEVSVGFIWDNGTLALLFGDGIQTTTKTVDLPMTQIETGSNVVHIAKGNPTIDIRSVCIFDTITENQWLNVIDL